MLASFHVLYQFTLIILFVIWCCVNSAIETALPNKHPRKSFNNNNNNYYYYYYYYNYNYNKESLVYVSDSWHTWRQIQAGEIGRNCDRKSPQQLLMVGQWTSWMVSGNMSYVQAQWRERTTLGVYDMFCLSLCICWERKTFGAWRLHYVCVSV
jgi:hypothetical protein